MGAVVSSSEEALFDSHTLKSLLGSKFDDQVFDALADEEGLVSMAQIKEWVAEQRVKELRKSLSRTVSE
jgi:hypothetical protein